MSAKLPTGRYSLSCAPYGDSIYCFGGVNDTTYLNQIVRYVRKYTDPEPTTSVGNEELPTIAKVVLDTASLISAGKMRSDCGDIRFVDNNTKSFDTALWTSNFSYYLSSGCNSANTIFLVNVSAISPNIGKTFYVYYGNPAVTSISTPITSLGNITTTLLPEETWIRISGGGGSLLIAGGGGNLTIK
jgi:hypothetical protein